jgi:WD40 repeat protein
MILWDLETKKKLHRFDEAAWPQFLPSNQVFVSLKGDSTRFEINEHDVKTGTTKKLYESELQMRAVALWANRQMVICRTIEASGEVLHFIDYGAKKRHSLPIGEDQNKVLCFSHDRKIVVVKYGWGTLKVFDWEAKKKIAEIETRVDPNETCDYCIFTRDDSALLAGVYAEKLQVWNWKAGKAGKLIKTIREPTGPCPWCPPALSPDGRLLATFRTSTVAFFDTKKLAYIGEAQRISGGAKGAKVERICFTPDGTGLVIGDSEGNLRVLDVPKPQD